MTSEFGGAAKVSDRLVALYAEAGEEASRLDSHLTLASREEKHTKETVTKLRSILQRSEVALPKKSAPAAPPASTSGTLAFAGHRVALHRLLNDLSEVDKAASLRDRAAAALDINCAYQPFEAWQGLAGPALEEAEPRILAGDRASAARAAETLQGQLKELDECRSRLRNEISSAETEMARAASDVTDFEGKRGTAWKDFWKFVGESLPVTIRIAVVAAPILAVILAIWYENHNVRGGCDEGCGDGCAGGGVGVFAIYGLVVVVRLIAAGDAAGNLKRQKLTAESDEADASVRLAELRQHAKTLAHTR